MASKKASIDPSFDFFSDKFEPLKALTTAGVTAPIPNARPRDNVHSCRSLLQPDDPNYLPIKKSPKSEQTPNRSTETTVVDDVVPALKQALSRFNSNFKPPKPIRHHRKIKQPAIASLVKAESPQSSGPLKEIRSREEEMARPMDGPLGLLKKLFEKKCRVKIWIRTATGIRGTCTG